MGHADASVAEETANEYAGLTYALEYAREIRGSRDEEADLRKELKQAHQESTEQERATESYRQLNLNNMVTFNPSLMVY